MKAFMRAKGRDNGPSDAIDIGPNSASRPPEIWGARLVVFMRLVAVLWMLQGLLHWKVILAPDRIPIDALPDAVASAVVFFAVMDVMASVGLWLAAAWGGVLWLFAACGGAIILLFMPEFHIGGRLFIPINVGLIVVYFFLTWNAAQERD
jgi:hypothetical protein